MRTVNYYTKRTPESIIAPVFLALSALQILTRYLFIRLDTERLFFDAAERWRPIAAQLADGKILYVTTLNDNKTPLWHGLNYLVHLTDYYIPVFFVLVGIANAAVAYLLWEWCQRHGHENAGVLAGVIYLSALPFIGGLYINVRSFSLAFLLAAILVDTPIRRGVYASISVLFSQVAVVALPILLYDGLRESESRVEWTAKYAVSGLFVGAIPFLATAAVWSPNAAIAGIQSAFLGAGEYITSHPDHSNPFLYPRKWATNLLSRALRLSYVLLPATAALAASAVHGTLREQWRPFTMSAALAGVFGITVVLKALGYYWMPVVAFAAPVGAIGLKQWFTSPTA